MKKKLFLLLCCCLFAVPAVFSQDARFAVLSPDGKQFVVAYDDDDFYICNAEIDSPVNNFEDIVAGTFYGHYDYVRLLELFRDMKIGSRL